VRDKETSNLTTPNPLPALLFSPALSLLLLFSHLLDAAVDVGRLEDVVLEAQEERACGRAHLHASTIRSRRGWMLKAKVACGLG
jgi:hypothetical protein